MASCKAADRVLPALARIRDELLIGRRQSRRCRIVLEGLVDLLDVEGDALRLAEELLRALHRLLELLERGVGQAREVARLVDQHLRLVLERGDLVVDLLQRARGREHVLRVVAGIEDDPPRVGRRDQDRRERERRGEHGGGQKHGARAGREGWSWLDLLFGLGDERRRVGERSAAQSTPRASQPGGEEAVAAVLGDDLRRSAPGRTWRRRRRARAPTSDRPSSNRRLPRRDWQ